MLALLARGGRDRDQELVRPVVAEDVRELVRRPEHADTVDAEVLLARVVVDDPDRRVAELARALHLLDHELARVAGADDDHFLASGDQPRRGRPLEDAPCQETRAGDKPEEQHAVHQRDASREPTLERIDEVDRVGGDHRSDDHAERGAPHVLRGDVAPPAVVEAERDEDGELDGDDDRDRRPEAVSEVRRDVEVEPQLEREPPGERDQPCVGRDLPQPVPVDRKHYETGAPTAERTVSTTRSWSSAAMPGHSGTEKFSAAARSVSGSDPGS